MEKLKFFKLLKLVDLNPSDVSYYYVYQDKLFYDYIAKVGDRFVNFCRVTDVNRPRYKLLAKFDRWIRENPCDYFEPSTVSFIQVDGQTWFYENMAFYQDVGKMTYADCETFDSQMQSFNQYVLPFKSQLSDSDKLSYNQVILEYSPDSMIESNHDILFEYGDAFRCFDCNRVTRISDQFKFTGYQGFLFYNHKFNINMIVMMSMLSDTLDEKEIKINLLDSEKTHTLDQLIDHQTERVTQYPDQFFKSSEFAKNLQDIKGIICKKLQ